MTCLNDSHIQALADGERLPEAAAHAASCARCAERIQERRVLMAAVTRAIDVPVAVPPTLARSVEESLRQGGATRLRTQERGRGWLYGGLGVAAATVIAVLFIAPAVRKPESTVSASEILAKSATQLSAVTSGVEVLEYELVLQVHPWNLNALNNAGICCFLLGDSARGGRFLLRAIETQPSDWRAHYNLGVMTDDHALLLKARDLGAPAERVLLSLFEAALRANDADGAVQCLKHARTAGVQVSRTVAARHPDLVRDPRFAEYLTEEK